MQVHRVTADGGTSIGPPLDKSWPDLKKLEWHAAAVTMDTGIEITVTPSDYRIGGWKQRGYYDVASPGSVSGPHTYYDAWSLINGINIGAMAIARTHDVTAVLEHHEAANLW